MDIIAPCSPVLVAAAAVGHYSPSVMVYAPQDQKLGVQAWRWALCLVQSAAVDYHS